MAKAKPADHSENNPLKSNRPLPKMVREPAKSKHIDKAEAGSEVREKNPKAKGADRSRTAEIARGPLGDA